VTIHFQAETLVASLLEGENPKDFLKHHLPGIERAKGVKRVAEFELEDIGIDNCQYFTGRGTHYSNWDAVYTGVGDNPAESIGDAIDAAATDGWVLPPSLEAQANTWPETPSVAANLAEEAQQTARSEIDREDFEDEADYETALAERAEEIMEDGDCDLYYYTAVWLREPAEGESPLIEAEDPKAVFKQAVRGYSPKTWPQIPRWQKQSRWGRDYERRRAFYMATRHLPKRDPEGNIERDAEGLMVYEPVSIRKSLPNTRFYRNKESGEHWVEFYNTDILKWDRNGNLTVDNGGFRKIVTRDRINQFLPDGWRIHPYQGEWFWFNNQWPENIRDRLYADQRARRKPEYPWWIPYTRGDTIRNDGTLVFGSDREPQRKLGLALPSGGLKTEWDAAMRPVPIGPQTVERRRRGRNNDPRQMRLNLEGKYLRNLAKWKRIKSKHERIKEVGKLQRDLEKVDKPDKKKPKKGHQRLR